MAPESSGDAPTLALIARSLPDALSKVRLPAPAFCIGGAELYTLALPLAHVLYITEIDRDFEGDVRFPPFDRTDWSVAAREPGRSPDGFDFAFVTYERLANRGA